MATQVETSPSSPSSRLLASPSPHACITHALHARRRPAECPDIRSRRASCRLPFNCKSLRWKASWHSFHRLPTLLTTCLFWQTTDGLKTVGQSASSARSWLPEIGIDPNWQTLLLNNNATHDPHWSREIKKAQFQGAALPSLKLSLDSDAVPRRHFSVLRYASSEASCPLASALKQLHDASRPASDDGKTSFRSKKVLSSTRRTSMRRFDLKLNEVERRRRKRTFAGRFVWSQCRAPAYSLYPGKG